MILAIDPGASTGWAAGPVTGGVTAFGTWRLRGGSAGPRLADLMDSMSSAISMHRPTEVWYETPFYNSRFPTAVFGLAQYCGVILCVAARYGIPAQGATPTQAKQAFGSGGHGKESMRHVAKMLGHDVTSDHEADAIAILYHAASRSAQQSLQLQSMRKRKR